MKLVKTSMNFVWVLVGGFLLFGFLLPAFALREAGSTPGTTFLRALGRDYVLCALGTLGYWACGFALMFGGSATGLTDQPLALDTTVSFTIGGKTFDVLGARGFFLAGSTNDPWIVAMFFFQMAFMMIAITILTGAMAGRWRLWSLCAYGLFFSMLLYPVYGAWVWGGGWLADLGVQFGLGNGHIDFAGSSVVHMTGGTAALAGAWILGPRIGWYSGDGSLNVIPCRSVTMVFLGTLILVFALSGSGSTLFVAALGEFAVEPGSTLVATDLRFGSIALCTMLAMLAGCLSSVLGTWLVLGKPNVIKACNGILAGAVAIAGPAAFVDSLGAVVIGTLAGVLVNGSALFVERVLTVDDPVGAISVHGICGGFGSLWVGLFANGTYGAGWNGVAAAPRGLFYGGGLGQLAAQMIGVAANFAWVFPVAVFCFWVVEKTIGNRIGVKPEH
jgi:Amt family ammonium transporter